MSKILIVEDEPNMRMGLRDNLEFEGYEVDSAEDGQDGLDKILNNKYSLVILDVMMPKMSGFDVCRNVRKKGINTPIILLTAKGEEIDKVLGLELGADDYVTKPFSPKELVARVKAVLRRFENKKSVNKKNKLFEINSDKYEVLVDGTKIELTTTEFKLLEFLYSKRGKVYSREELMNNIWDEDKIIIDRTIDVHIKNLREKLGKAGGLIKNIRGIGYKMEE